MSRSNSPRLQGKWPDPARLRQEPEMRREAQAQPRGPHLQAPPSQFGRRYPDEGQGSLDQASHPADFEGPAFDPRGTSHREAAPFGAAAGGNAHGFPHQQQPVLNMPGGLGGRRPPHPQGDGQGAYAPSLSGAHGEGAYDPRRAAPGSALGQSMPSGLDAGQGFGRGQPQRFGSFGQAPDPYVQRGQDPGPDPYGAFGATSSPGWDGHGGHGGHGDGASHDDGAYPSFGAPQHFEDEYGQEPQDVNFDRIYNTSYGDDGAAASYDEPVPPRRRGSWAIVALVLAGAIVTGGGLAYAYRTWLHRPPPGDAPVVHSEGGLARTEAVQEAGNQQKLAFADRRLVDGSAAPEGGAAQEAASAPESSSGQGGARRVKTVEVGRDGSIMPPDSSGKDPSGNGPVQTSVPVPGLTLVNGPNPSGAPPQAAPAPAEPQPAPPKKVTLLSKVEPDTATNAESNPVHSSAGARRQSAATPLGEADETGSLGATAQSGETRKAAPKRTAAAAPVSTATGNNGFVAVLGSVPVSANSRMDALKRFADLQQRYSSLLQDKTPDVREANIEGKGVYHRLLVGPPASREQANALCSELKAAGYGGCWVTAY